MNIPTVNPAEQRGKMIKLLEDAMDAGRRPSRMARRPS